MPYLVSNNKKAAGDGCFFISTMCSRDFVYLLLSLFLQNSIRDVAQSGSVPRSGRGGRWFESSHPDIGRHSFSAKETIIESERNSAESDVAFAFSIVVFLCIAARL